MPWAELNQSNENLMFDWPTVLMRLPKADPRAVEALLLRRWRTVAPKRLVREFDAAKG